MEQYKQLNKQNKKECRAAKADYFTLQCEELLKFDRKHNPLLFLKIKDMEIRKKHLMNCIKHKQRKILTNEEEILKDRQNTLNNYIQMRRTNDRN